MLPATANTSALPDGENLLGIITEAAIDAIIIINNDGRISLWNKAAERLFGYDSSEALGQDLHTLITPPRYRDAGATAFANFRTTGHGAALGKTLKLAGIRKNGTEFPLELSLSAAHFRDKWIAVGIVRDITARNQVDLALTQSEAKFRSIIEMSPVPHSLNDGNKNLTLLNPAFVKLFGYTLDDIPTLSAWTAKAYPDAAYRLWVAATLRAHLAEAKQSGAEFVPVEVNICCKDNTVRTVTTHLVTIEQLSRGTHLTILHDRTRQKLAEEQVRAQMEEIASINAQLRETNRLMQQAQSQLLQSEKMASIGQLAAGVAHEINNPLGFINSNIGSLDHYLKSMFALLDAYERAMSSAPPDTDHAEVLSLRDQIDFNFLKEDVLSLMAESKDGVERVKKIVDDLKDFSHADEAEWQWADLHKGLDSTLSVASHELKYKADVVREYGDLPLVECLPGQINQVFMNLLVNAAQAISGRGTITLRTAREGDKVRIEVTDTGSGIGPETLKHIFDPFFTTKPVGTGPGLGLSLSYGIIEKHHGRIEVNSEVGKGTTFRVTLPVRQPN